MSTATLCELPTLVTPGLVLAAAFDLDDDVQSDLDGYHADGRDFDGRVHGSKVLHDDRARLLAGALTTTVGDMQKRGAELVKRRAALEETHAELRWRKYSLIPLLIPAAQQAAAEANDEYERVIQAEIAGFAEVGITAETIDAGRLGNLEAAQHQLRHRALKTDTALMFQCLKNEAACAVDVLKSQFNCPTPDQCAIRWETVSGFPAQIATLAGVLTAPPMQIEIRTQKARKLAIELGFERAALLPSHCDQLEAIGELLPEGHRPLSLVTPKNLDRVRKLVGELPPTIEVTRFLRATEKGVIRHVI